MNAIYRVSRIAVACLVLATPGPLTRLPLDKEKTQDVEDITPRK